MKGPGILGTIGLAGTLIFAIPVVLIGIEKLLAGDVTLGVLFLGIAALMVGLQQFLSTPADLPGDALGKVVGTIAKDPEEKE
jgi:hypothetical protein